MPCRPPLRHSFRPGPPSQHFFAAAALKAPQPSPEGFLTPPEPLSKPSGPGAKLPGKNLGELQQTRFLSWLYACRGVFQRASLHLECLSTGVLSTCPSFRQPALIWLGADARPASVPAMATSQASPESPGMVNVCPRTACSQLTVHGSAGPVGKESAESLFVKELKRRGLDSNKPSIADEAPSDAEEIQPLTPPQLAKSRALGAEGLEVQPFAPLLLLHATAVRRSGLHQLLGAGVASPCEGAAEAWRKLFLGLWALNTDTFSFISRYICGERSRASCYCLHLLRVVAGGCKPCLLALLTSAVLARYWAAPLCMEAAQAMLLV